MQPGGRVEDCGFRVCEPRLTAAVGEVDPGPDTRPDEIRGQATHGSEEVNQITVGRHPTHERRQYQQQRYPPQPDEI